MKNGFVKNILTVVAAASIVFIDGGRIVEEGAPDDILVNPRTERLQKFLKTFEY